MDALQKITDQLEYLFLKQIVTGLRNDSMEIVDTKKYAQEFLQIEPFASIDDAKSKMHSFATKYQGFKVLDDYMNAYEKEQKVDAVIQKMKKYIDNKDIDAALIVAKGS